MRNDTWFAYLHSVISIIYDLFCKHILSFIAHKITLAYSINPKGDKCFSILNSIHFKFNLNFIKRGLHEK